MKKTQKSILKAQEVIKSEKSAMLETIKNVENSVESYDLVLEEIENNMEDLETMKSSALSAKREAIEYRNKLAEIIGE